MLKGKEERNEGVTSAVVMDKDKRNGEESEGACHSKKSKKNGLRETRKMS